MVNDTPKYVLWNGRSHTITKIGFHHEFREGRVLYHVFSVSTENSFMKLRLDSEALSWHLMEVSDSFN